MRTALHLVIRLGVVSCLAGCSTAPVSPALAPVAVDVPEDVSIAKVPEKQSHEGPLTMEEAVRRALAGNSRVEVLQAAVHVAEQRKRAATDISDPELGVSWGRNNSDDLSRKVNSRNLVSESTSHQSGSSVQTKNGSSVSSDGSSETSASTETLNNSSASSTRSTDTRSTTTSGIGGESGDGWKISARFFVPNPWILGPRVDAKRAEIHAAQADEQTAQWMIACDVRRLFSEINYLVRDMAFQEELLRLDGDILKVVKSRAEQGAATSAEAMTAARRHLMVQNGLDQSRQRYKIAQRGLAALLNIPPVSLLVDTNMPAFSGPLEPPVSADWAETVALRSRNDIAALRWRVLAAHAAYREARNVRYPWIKEINASYRSTDAHSWGTDTTTGSGYGSGSTSSSGSGSGENQGTKLSSGGTTTSTGEQSSKQEQSVSRSTSSRSEFGMTDNVRDDINEEWWVGVAVDVPIFSWGKNQADKVLMAQYELAGANETEGLRQISREVRDALDELGESRQQQARSEGEIAGMIAEMRKALANQENTPNAMPDQIAQAKVQIVEAQRVDLEIRWRNILARLNLERAVGSPLPETVK